MVPYQLASYLFTRLFYTALVVSHNKSLKAFAENE